ncbi:GL24270 [Drosophila persimilis]|uniref:GL24270 n=1 Tax=Drosophila persimilis TaxID=7234 RepID=B4G507_DROPE|nr:helicase SKI2W [Drosophila persimilis]EDW24673.1 GL24270 [Drosophila persimilis]
MGEICGEDNFEKLRNYILRPDISIHDPLPDVLPRKIDPMRLLHVPKCPGSTKLVPRRDLSGEILEFVEVDLEDVGANANNSMSMQREPGLLEEATRGSHMNYPFWPGGFDEQRQQIAALEVDSFDFGDNLLTVPPGFASGHDFAQTQAGDAGAPKTGAATTVDLLDNLEQDLDVQEWMQMTRSENEAAKGPQVDLKFPSSSAEFQDVDDQIMKADLKPVLNISTTAKAFSSDWAEMVDISQPISDFKEQIPCPAMDFPFELDVFQKQAILKLEQRQYVFVAAHTSAGKTVVAEYAIALSKRDLTRTIYTSPIKALSNQKYRDFRKTFKDVGLITGDLQIEPTASCLIMTTEILRSMLYCGSDITRDLEYVIFDEVHYINNPERGHVWEEVIILLPDHVNIIMLSATVPNTMELADWVGSTKKRKVYVISTLKRPVPLQHFLYTGAGGKSRDDIFLLVDANGRYLQGNYEKAVERKKEMQGKSKSGAGASGSKNYVNAKQEQYTWIGLIDFLKRNNKMPVVAFTLSRNRCDTNVAALQSVDLNTEKEKGAVQKFFLQCLAKLKPPDRSIPQVMVLKDALERGIGVHHSGILPILKEIVEMLFQNGLVKLLFATETFSMGVNMPARTVVFDSHKKFDGLEVRNLKPGEYIQMAGRAGRRGHDETGTVIVLCKGNVPPSMELRPMILGLPEKLQSQFILRYAVILTCLRIESIKVEDIMQFSFKEFNQKLQLPTQQKQLRIAEDKFAMLPTLGEHLQPLVHFYDKSIHYWKEKHRVMKFIVTQAKIQKELKVGRVIVITQGKHYNKLGILLNIKSVLGKDTMYKVLVLDHQFKAKENELVNRGEFYYKILSLTPKNKFFQPEGIGGHAVLDIKAIDIVSITKSTFKVDADVVIRNWEQRQLERFKDTPPGATVVKAVSDLHQLNENYIANVDSIKFINLAKEINVNADTEVDLLQSVEQLGRQVADLLPHTNIAGFEQEFAKVYERRMLELHIEELRFKNSAKNLSLYPDYCNKLKVLHALNYIDEQNEVTLKGKVACEMGQNELLITELILCNMFNDLEPAEIAALLSGLVFQAKIQGEPVIPEALKECVAAFEQISDKILAEEQRFQASTESESRLNFGLLEVVYEWARNKPFAEIMKLTEVQEGIIVRCIQQLDETLRDVKTAAIRIGNPGLQAKMEEASAAIKRDIVFTASLYTEL